MLNASARARHGGIYTGELGELKYFIGSPVSSYYCRGRPAGKRMGKSKIPLIVLHAVKAPPVVEPRWSGTGNARTEPSSQVPTPGPSCQLLGLLPARTHAGSHGFRSRPRIGGRAASITGAPPRSGLHAHPIGNDRFAARRRRAQWRRAPG